MNLRSKPHQVTVTAMSRELASFIWAIATRREAEMAK